MQIKKLVVAIPFVVSTCYAIDGPTYYTDLTDPPRQIVFDQNHIAAFGIASPMKTCEPEDRFHCFDGAGFRFAVPKGALTEKGWVFAGEKYTVTRSEKFSLLGLPIDVTFISNGNGRMTFFYSPERGLIGFRTSGSRPRVFLLENLCGFGAPSTCEKQVREQGSN